MRINSIKSNTGTVGRSALAKGTAGSAGPNVLSRMNESEKFKNNLKQNNYDEINTSIKSNPDARVSFKGAPLLHKAAHFSADCPLVAEALFALVITCGLRPISIMATASNEEEKDKCSYQAAKSISSGIVGLVMTAIVGGTIGAATKKAATKEAAQEFGKQKSIFEIPPEIKKDAEETVKKGVAALKEISDNLKGKGSEQELVEEISHITKDGNINTSNLSKTTKNPVKSFITKIKEVAPDKIELIEKAIGEQAVLNNYQKAAKNVADKFFQPIFMPLRAIVTIALIPVLLKAMGLKKPDKTNNENIFNSLATNSFSSEKSKEVFQPFLGAIKNENK